MITCPVKHALESMIATKNKAEMLEKNNIGWQLEFANDKMHNEYLKDPHLNINTIAIVMLARNRKLATNMYKTNTLKVQTRKNCPLCPGKKETIKHIMIKCKHQKEIRALDKEIAKYIHRKIGHDHSEISSPFSNKCYRNGSVKRGTKKSTKEKTLALLGAIPQSTIKDLDQALQKADEKILLIPIIKKMQREAATTTHKIWNLHCKASHL